MTDRELMQQALDALDLLSRVPKAKRDYADRAIAALRERLAQPEQEFTTHEEGKDGWSDWVCPDPQSYLMKCCDCGLVHEAQFGVVRYTDTAEKENCDMVDDPNLQAVFRMRRSEQWTPKDTAYRPGGLAQPEQEPVFDCPRCGHCCPPQGIYYTPPQRKPLTDAVLAEREACAALLDANAMACENPIYRSLLQANAQAIREMGQP